jgi:hypothetical protein
MSDMSPTPEGAFTLESREQPSDRIPSLDATAPAVASTDHQRTPSVTRRHGVTVLIAATVAAVVATAISVGVQSWVAKGDRLIQQGKVMVAIGGEHEVFYPVPFASPPNVQLEGNGVNWNAIKLTEQKPDHFKIKSTADFGLAQEIRWRAEGVRRE